VLTSEVELEGASFAGWILLMFLESHYIPRVAQLYWMLVFLFSRLDTNSSHLASQHAVHSSSSKYERTALWSNRPS